MLDLSSFDLSSIEQKVFQYFSEISAVPRGSGNRKMIADYCENFAKSLKLKYIRDDANNIVIFKNGSNGGEKAAPIILQGHLDIVCQAAEDCKIDFSKDGLEIYREGDFIKAKGTTLGADNGIAIAYIMAILSSNDIKHPPIEAIFTADEEIGLLGAGVLDCSSLKAKKMINLDSETDDVLTVSCAGGQDVVLKIPVVQSKKEGTSLSLSTRGLLGGHSGVEIDKGRTNANLLMGEILSFLNENCKFNIISINGGKKPNAIPNSCTAEICTKDSELILHLLSKPETLFLSKIKETEPDFCFEIKKGLCGTYQCFDNNTKNGLLYLLKAVPDGVVKMSEEIEGLVETSLNLGILTTDNENITAHYALRSNKEAELHILTEKILMASKKAKAKSDVFGFYPPWEYNPHSSLRELYETCFNEVFNKEISIEAIHAGLECGVFANKIKELDCISVGPNLFDVHTPNERLDIVSAIKTFGLLLKVLAEIANSN